MLAKNLKDQIQDNIYSLLILIPSVVCTILGYFIDIKPYIIEGHHFNLWQCFTYLFFSTTPLHLLINIVATFIVLDAFKDYPGYKKPLFFLVFILAGMVSGIWSIVINPSGFYTAGLSGAIYFSFSFLMFEELTIGENRDKEFHKLGWIVFWIINIYGNYMASVNGIKIDIVNHIAGFMLGLTVGTIVYIIRSIQAKWKKN